MSVKVLHDSTSTLADADTSNCREMDSEIKLDNVV